MFLPLYFTSSVSRLYRLPLQISQGTYTSGKKVHFDFDDAVPAAGFAAAALDVKAEAALLVAAHLGFIRRGKHIANIVKHAGIGGRIGTRGAADRRLVDIDDFVQMLEPAIALCSPGRVLALFNSRASVL